MIKIKALQSRVNHKNPIYFLPKYKGDNCSKTFYSKNGFLLYSSPPLCRGKKEMEVLIAAPKVLIWLGFPPDMLDTFFIS